MRVLPHQGPPRLLTGRDTRESGFWIERTLARGVRAMGGDLLSAGVVPTPAVAVITREQDFDAGLVISASHNPYQDNGIKVFSGHGQKFDEGLERQIEARAFQKVKDAMLTSRREADGSPTSRAKKMKQWEARL